MDEDSRPAGVEKERYVPSSFDTERLFIKKQLFTISTVVRKLKKGLIIAAEIQRDSDIWDTGMKSRLIESILLQLPLPLFYVSEGRDENLYITDGLQRINALRSFMSDEKSFALEGLEFLRHLEGKKYNDLPENIQIRIEETPLQFVIIGMDNPPEVQRNIFKRLNTGSCSISPSAEYCCTTQ